MALIDAYYKSLPFADPKHITNHPHKKYFNFFLEEASPDFHTLTLKEGDILGFGAFLLCSFFSSLAERAEACLAYHDALIDAIPRYEDLFQRMEDFSKSLPAALEKHFRVKWILHTKTLLSIYKWYTFIYKAREYCLSYESEAMKNALRAAAESLEDYLSFRKCAEYGVFENWYRGDLKMNVKQHLYDTYRRLGQTPNFS